MIHLRRPQWITSRKAGTQMANTTATSTRNLTSKGGRSPTPTTLIGPIGQVTDREITRGRRTETKITIRRPKTANRRTVHRADQIH